MGINKINLVKPEANIEVTQIGLPGEALVHVLNNYTVGLTMFIAVLCFFRNISSTVIFSEVAAHVLFSFKPCLRRERNFIRASSRNIILYSSVHI